ncbi:MAG TPA: 16S rRNA (cytosine(967)-C(5))-methyltransferase RsmB [Terriglobales bacterium]
MSISPARRAAFDVLLKVEREDAYAVELLHGAKLDELSAADRGLATEIVMGSLRWQGVLDRVLTVHLSRAIDRLDAEVRVALRLGAYQLLYLERVPAHAAVNESVELVRRARKQSAAPLTNAVLRKLSQNSPEIENANEIAHPAWLVERWRKNYGDEAASRICEYDQQAPDTALRSAPEVERELAAEGVELAPGRLLTSARRLRSGNLQSTRAFRECRIAAQDEGSQLVALLVGRGQNILDCCAAPGGKTALLAERNPQSRIVALELHPHRARLLRERVPHANVEVRTEDATKLDGAPQFDCVLVDVPCSGTGTLARNPEIRWKLNPDDIVDLQRRQQQILRAALTQVVPGGRLVYSTCSLEPEECEGVVRTVLASAPEFTVVPCAQELQRLRDCGEIAWQDVRSLVQGEFLRTLPGVHPCEGFFATIIARRPA